MHFAASTRAQDYLQRLGAFMQEHVLPGEAEYCSEVQNVADWRAWKQPSVMEELKAKARSAGLWNLFLPEKQYAAGLTNVEYAPLAEMMGQCSIAPEVFNCNPPDTGNMEVLVKYGSEEQKRLWLKPLLAGEIRSAFCMTEPGIASSDATNMQATAVLEGEQVVLNGRKWWSSGVGHPHCRLLIFMGLTDCAGPPRAGAHSSLHANPGGSGTGSGASLPALVGASSLRQAVGGVGRKYRCDRQRAHPDRAGTPAHSESSLDDRPTGRQGSEERNLANQGGCAQRCPGDY